MAAVNILSVCGSGTVTSSMVAAKLKEKLGEIIKEKESNL